MTFNFSASAQAGDAITIPFTIFPPSLNATRSPSLRRGSWRRPRCWPGWDAGLRRRRARRAESVRSTRPGRGPAFPLRIRGARRRERGRLAPPPRGDPPAPATPAGASCASDRPRPACRTARRTGPIDSRPGTGPPGGARAGSSPERRIRPSWPARRSRSASAKDFRRDNASPRKLRKQGVFQSSGWFSSMIFRASRRRDSASACFPMVAQALAEDDQRVAVETDRRAAGSGRRLPRACGIAARHPRSGRLPCRTMASSLRAMSVSG